MSGTLLFSGTDLSTLCVVEDLNDFWSSSDVRGDLATYPGVDGAVSYRRPIASKICSGQATVALLTPTAAEDAVAAVKALMAVDVAQVVTRRKITSSGTVDTTQTAIVRNISERWIGDNSACTLLFTVEVTNGTWHGASVAISSAAGTQVILGDTRTRRMTITLVAGAARTVTNSTNGYWFTFGTTVPTGGITVDVEARTATAITGGTDYSGYLSWGKAALFQLEAGSNVLTVSAGTAAISYQPAYL